jgi:hypothetical protein
MKDVTISCAWNCRGVDQILPQAYVEHVFYSAFRAAISGGL